jgi:hypothetical protein
MIKEEKGYTVLDTIPVAEQENRTLPNSDPAKGGNFTYQKQPWDQGTDSAERNK